MRTTRTGLPFFQSLAVAPFLSSMEASQLRASALQERRANIGTEFVDKTD